MRLFPLLFLFVIMLAGCAAPASRWRDDAFSRFNSVIAAGSRQFAPEETDTIRQTLALADRYFTRQMHDDADRLYQLSCQKSQLLYRHLILSKLREGSTLAVQNEATKQSEEIVISADSVSIREVLEQVAQEQHSPDFGESGIICNDNPEVDSIPDRPPSVPSSWRESPVNEVEDYSGLTEILPTTDTVSSDTSSVAATDADQHKKLTENKAVPASISKSLRSVLSPLKLDKSITRRNTVIKRSEPGRTTIYLTFDDGPSRLTLPIASYLNSQGIAATFFALGSNIKGHEKIVRDTVALGHRVGNHTLSHDLRKLNSSLNQSVNEIEKTAALIEKLGGDGKMVRIPYGASSKTLASTVASEGGQIFDWDIDSLDSSRRGANDHALIERAVIHQLQKSDKRHIIMLFHDGGGHDATLAAIRNLVPRLKQEGYRFGLLSRNDRVAQSRAERNLTP